MVILECVKNRVCVKWLILVFLVGYVRRKYFFWHMRARCGRFRADTPQIESVNERSISGGIGHLSILMWIKVHYINQNTFYRLRMIFFSIFDKKYV